MKFDKAQLAKLQAVVDGLSLDDAVTLYNAVCYECNYPDSMIFRISELDALLGDLSPSEIVRRVSYGDFSYGYKYFTYDGYGNLKSIRRAHDLAVDLADVLSVYEEDPSQLPDPVKDFLNELNVESAECHKEKAMTFTERQQVIAFTERLREFTDRFYQENIYDRCHTAEEPDKRAVTHLRKAVDELETALAEGR